MRLALYAIGLAAAFFVTALTFRALMRGPDAAPARAGPAAAAELTLSGDKDNGRAVALKSGGRLNIDLASNPSTGFQWTVAERPACLDLSATKTTAPVQSENIVGAPGRQIFEFVAVGACAGKLLLEYRRPWEKDAAAAQSFEVSVHIE